MRTADCDGDGDDDCGDESDDDGDNDTDYDGDDDSDDYGDDDGDDDGDDYGDADDDDGTFAGCGMATTGACFPRDNGGNLSRSPQPGCKQWTPMSPLPLNSRVYHQLGDGNALPNASVSPLCEKQRTPSYLGQSSAVRIHYRRLPSLQLNI